MKMKQISFIFLITFFTSGAFAGKIKKRKIELEWNEQKNIKYYEMEVYKKESELPLKSEKSANQFFTTTLPLGSYKVRSRFMNQTNELSPWSNFEDLVVEVPVGKIKKYEGSLFHQADLKDKKAKVPIDWELIPHIKNYKIEILNQNNKIVYSNKVSQAPFEVDLPQGEYKYTVTPFDEYGNEGEKSIESPAIIVSMAKLPTPSVDLKSQPSDSESLSVEWSSYAGSYIEVELYYRRIFSKDWKIVKKIPEIKSSPWYPPKDLVPGEYRLSCRALSADAQLSDPKLVEFKIKPKKPDLKGIAPDHLFR